MSQEDVDSAVASASEVQEDSPVPTSDTLSIFLSEAGITRTQLNNLVRGGSARPSQNVPPFRAIPDPLVKAWALF